MKVDRELDQSDGWSLIMMDKCAEAPTDEWDIIESDKACILTWFNNQSMMFVVIVFQL